MERKLASVQIISEIKEHPNADSLLIAKVLGWDVIVNKAENFKVGDKVVYFEIDSFLPIREEFEFLRKSSYKNSPILGEGFKLKPVRLRGIVSCGLILPLSVFFSEDEINDMEIGLDVSDKLNVRKWEEPQPAVLGGDVLGRRPSFIKKTDETRIQNVPDILNEFYNCPYDIYATVKIDGSSHSIGIDKDDVFHATSHNMDLKLINKEGTFVNFCIKHDLENKLRKLKNDLGLQEIVVQGEYAGPGIQKNKLGLQKPNWYVFSCDFNGERVDLEQLELVCEMLDVDIVPVIEILTAQEFKEKYPDEETLLNRVIGDDAGIYKNGQQEGLVFRPLKAIYSPLLGCSLSIKAINNEYLLKD